ncbi:hypothetical protein C495_00010 [Natronorubrum sulfidifaciens JCM 14089]|uniref:DUF7282 domain-containing protein n=2 Tax=Natronorubrum sulfidifaciens TaxID=388259 RepID=L9WJB1_9EURY|nr:hypothetical protein C495_00010 [Natronorubrum sulfidifaciens JCM 14089]
MVAGATPAATVDEDTATDDEYDDATDEPDTEPNEEQPTETDADDAQDAHVTFSDQTTDGETVVVDDVTMASGGFVTIHDSSLLVGDVLESVIGTSEYLESGTHENVEVTLDEPLEEDETLIAMPHRDTNENQEYDFVETEGEEDGPYLTADDEPVTDQAVVTVGDADEDPVANGDDALDEEPVDESVDEEPAEEKPTEEPVDEEPAEEKPTDEPVDEEPAEEKPTDEPVDEEPVEEKPTDEPVDEEPAEEKPADEPVDEEPAEEKPTDESVDEEPAEEKSADEPVDEEPAEEPIDEPVDEEPAEEPIDEPVDEEPAEEPTDEQPVDEPIEDESEVAEDDVIEIVIERATVYVYVGELPDDMADGEDAVGVDAANDDSVADDGEIAGDDPVAEDDDDMATDDDMYDDEGTVIQLENVELDVTINELTIVPVDEPQEMTPETDDELDEDAADGLEDDAVETESDADDVTMETNDEAADDTIVIEEISVFVVIEDLDELLEDAMEDQPVHEEADGLENDTEDAEDTAVAGSLIGAAVVY